MKKNILQSLILIILCKKLAASVGPLNAAISFVVLTLSLLCAVVMLTLLLLFSDWLLALV